MMTQAEPKNIDQQVTLDAAPHAVYEALMDSQRHAAFTGNPAQVSREVGGAVSCYGGYISAVNVELVPDRRVVQAWRGKDWPEGTYSIIRFDLAPEGQGTRLHFTQTGVPAEHHGHISQGWHSQYWDKLKAYLKQG